MTYHVDGGVESIKNLIVQFIQYSSFTQLSY